MQQGTSWRARQGEAWQRRVVTCAKLLLRDGLRFDGRLVAYEHAVLHRALVQVQRKATRGAIASPNAMEETFDASDKQPLLTSVGLSAATVNHREHTQVVLLTAQSDGDRLDRHGSGHWTHAEREEGVSQGEQRLEGMFLPPPQSLSTATSLLRALLSPPFPRSSLQMPRFTRRGGNDAPLLALSDGVNERALRAAAARASQREEVDVGGNVNAEPQDAQVAQAGEVQTIDAGDAQAGDAAHDGGGADDTSVDSIQQPVVPEEAVGNDVFDFPADDEARVDEAVVDGEMAREEDAREHRAAEAAVEEDGGEGEGEGGGEEEEAVQLDAVVVQPVSRLRGSSSAAPRPPMPYQPAPSRYAFHLGRGGKKMIPKRRRVLRNTIQGIVRAPRP